MKAALKALPVAKAMAEEGNPASASDSGVGALAATAAVRGAQLNVRINSAGLQDKAMAAKLNAEAEAIAAEAMTLQDQILEIVNSQIQ